MQLAVLCPAPAWWAKVLAMAEDEHLQVDPFDPMEHALVWIHRDHAWVWPTAMVAVGVLALLGRRVRGLTALGVLVLLALAVVAANPPSPRAAECYAGLGERGYVYFQTFRGAHVEMPPCFFGTEHVRERDRYEPPAQALSSTERYVIRLFTREGLARLGLVLAMMVAVPGSRRWPGPRTAGVP